MVGSIPLVPRNLAGGTDPGGLNYDDYRAFLSAAGFRELTRTARGWTRELTAAGGGHRAAAG